VFSKNSTFRFAALCKDGSVVWEGSKVGLWWKDDFSGYNFAPFAENQAKVSAVTKTEFRNAVSANVSEFMVLSC
jgi:hypothetical protein